MDSEDIQVKLGRVIRRLRAERGLSQEAFADLVGLHRTYMGGVERGQRNVGVRNLARIAAALDMTVSELFARIESDDAGRDRDG